MSDFLKRLSRDPYAPIDAASTTRVDELGNGYDDWGNLIAPKYTAPEQTWGETALGVATAPARIATALAGSLSPYGQDGWQVPPIVSEGVDALTAVGDAYTGKMAPEEIPGRALGMAGFMMGGGGPALALERSLAQRGISSTADMIPTGVKDYGQAAYRSIRYPHETPVIGPMSDMDIWQRFGMSTREGKDLNNAPFWEESDGTLNMLYPDGPDTYGAFSGPNRLANEPGVPGDVNAYKAKPVRPDIEVIDGGLLDRLSNAYAPDNQLNMFGGRNAKTANLERLAIAERLAAEGADRNAIWNETGWFQGPDSKWRFEIDDSGLRQRKFDDELRGLPPIASDMAWKHDDLFNAYPEVGDYPYYLSQEDKGGLFSRTNGEFNPVSKRITQYGESADKGNFLHEMQHGLQEYEGFSKGYNPNQAAMDIEQAKWKERDYRQKSERMQNAHSDEARVYLARASQGDAEAQAFVKQAQDKWFAKLGEKTDDNPFGVDLNEAVTFELTDTDPVFRSVSSTYQDAFKLSRMDPHELYKRHAGEVEARNVQKRMNMSADQRRATPPWETQDIPDADQIVRMYSNASEKGALPAILAGQEGKPIRAYHGATSPYEGDAYNPKKSQYKAFFAAEDPAYASKFARDYGESPRVYPVDIAPTANLFDYTNTAHTDRLAKAVSEKPHILANQYLVGPDTIQNWIRQGDAGILEDRGVQSWLRKKGYDGWKFEDTAGLGDNRTSYGMLKPGHVRSATTGEILFSNADNSASVPAIAGALDMSTEARLARAKEMGFDTDRVYYHGTGRDFESFDMKKANDAEGRKRGLGNGAGKVYLTPSPDAASNWAMEAPRRRLGNAPNVIPTYVRGELADDALWQDTFQRLSGGRPSYDSSLSMSERDTIISQVDAELKDNGYAGIQTRYRNADGNIAEVGQTAIFDPRNIRSVNAAFDPAKSDSANLLAANSDSRPALLAGAAHDTEDGYADGGSVSLPGPYSIAKSMVGQREGRGNDLLNRFLNGDTSGMTSAEYAWCSRFVKQAAAKAGVDVSKATDMARSWLDVGQPVDKPAVGDVVVLSRGNPNSQYGHVGFYEGTNPDGTIKILSGNHNNAVASGSYPASRVLGYRRLDGQPDEAYDPATGQQGLKPLAMMDGVGREVPALPTPTPEPSTQVAEQPKSSFDFTKLASLFAEPEQAQAPQVQFTPIQAFQPQGSPIQASTPYRGTFAHGGQVRGLPDQSEPIHAGPLHSTVPGRTDHLPITVAAGSFVLPADIVSSLGEGNTNAGMEAVSKMFPLPPVRRADGGRVPIAAAGGEFVIAPETVAAVGNGDMETGHELLDQFVRRTRAQNIQRLRALPGPEK